MDITIIIPFYNRAADLKDFLDRSDAMIRGLNAAGWTGCHVILVDNGSTDKSHQIAEEFCRTNQPLYGSSFQLLTEQEHGAPAARNRGLQACTTEWVYFFDCDDSFESLPHASSSVFQECDMVCFPVRMQVGGKTKVRDYRPTARPADHILSAMLSTQSMIFRTEWLRSIGGWDNRCRIWNDWELGLRALLHHPRLQWLEERAFHCIHVHDDSITGPSYTARWEAIRDTLIVAYDEIRRLGDAESLRALHLRCHIVSGMLRREGSPEAAAIIRALAAPSRWGYFLAWYAAHGGRGAWRIALAIL